MLLPFFQYYSAYVMCVFSFFSFLYKYSELLADYFVIYVEPRHWIVLTNLLH